MKASFQYAVKKKLARMLAALMAAILLLSLFGGIAPANAAEASVEGLNISTAENGPGKGILTISHAEEQTRGAFPSITGGSFDNGIFVMTIPAGESVSEPYTCTDAAAEITVHTRQKGGTSVSLLAPCGEAAPEPPAPVWGQSAIISGSTLGDDGLATVNVTYNNNGSNQEGTFTVVVNQETWKTTPVRAHESFNDVVSGIPAGAFVEVYGNALPNALDSLTVGTPLPDPSYLGMTLDGDMFSTLTPTGPFNQIDSVFPRVTQDGRVVESQNHKETDGTAPIRSHLPINPPLCGDYVVEWLRTGSNEQVASIVVQQASCTPEEPPAEEEPPVEEEPKPTPIEYAMTLDGSKSTLTASGPLKQPVRLGLAVFVNDKMFGDAPEYVLFDGTAPVSATVELPKCNSYVVAWVRETGGVVRAVPVTQDICPEKPAPVPDPEPEKEPGKDPKPVDETDSDKDPAEKPADTKKNPVKSETPSKVDVKTSNKTNVNVSVRSETTVIKKNAAPHKAKHDSAVKEKQVSNDKRPRYTFDTAASPEPQQATHHALIAGFCVLMILVFAGLLWRQRRV